MARIARARHSSQTGKTIEQSCGEVRLGDGGEVCSRVASILGSLDAAFPDRLIVEDPGQQINDIYTETHFVLASILTDLVTAASHNHAARAEERLRRWQALKTETPFNNLANCVSLALLRARGLAGTSLFRLLHTICAGQSLKKAPRRSGNNIVVMKALTDLVFRPLALGEALSEATRVDADRLLDRYLSSEGFYFDTPRAGQEDRLFPGAYCLKFLFLIGLAHLLTGCAGFRTRFVTGLRALTPYFADDGCFGYLGRSDNTTFADGLAIFCLRLGIALDAEGTGMYAGLLRAAETRFLSTPLTSGGWPKANHSVGDDRDDARARDDYARPTEYAAAAAAYILLGALALPTIPKIDPWPRKRHGPQISHDLKLVRLATREAEVFIRTGGEIGPAGRRYLGPTILRASLAQRLLIGAIPIRVADDDDTVVETRAKSKGNHVLRLAKLWADGTEELDPGTVGFLPYLVGSREYCIPDVQIIQELGADRFIATYSMRRFRHRGPSIALGEVATLLLKNLHLPVAHSKGPVIRTDDHVRLARSVIATDDSVIIEDRLDNSAGWKEFRIATRALSGVRVTVEGMRWHSQGAGWSSDGPVKLALYTHPAGSGSVGCRIKVQFNDTEQTPGAMPAHRGS